MGRSYHRGYTLIELLAVIILIAALTVSISSRFQKNSSFQALATRDDIVAGLFYAQQIAMARDSAANPVQFVASGTTIDVREGGSSVGGIYPLQLPAGFSVTAATLDYDKLGRTTAATLLLGDGDNSIQINVSGAGFAR